MMENSNEICPVAKDYGNLFTLKLNILENGPKDIEMVKDHNNMKMERFIQETFLKIKKMEQELLNFLMEEYFKDNLKTII